MNVRSLPLDRMVPLLFAKDDVLVSRSGDITIGWRMSLPSMYSLEGEDYDRMIGLIHSASRLLPPWTVIHKQDSFFRRPVECRGTGSFLGDASARHFDGRSYLHHECHLYLTFSTREAIHAGDADNSALGFVRTPGLPGREAFERAEMTAASFASQLDDGTFGMARLTSDDYMDGRGSGILSDYLRLGGRQSADMAGERDRMVIGDSHAVFHTVHRSSDLPAELSSVRRSERFEGGTDVLLSSGSAYGVALDREHIVNQYMVIVPQVELLRELEMRRRENLSMALGSKRNTLDLQEIDETQEEILKDGITMVRTHVNVMTWGAEDDLPLVRDDVEKAFTMAGLETVRVLYNAPCLWTAGFPGGASELAWNQYMTLELECALCLWPMESYQRDIHGGTLSLCDRHRIIPLRADLHGTAKGLSLVENYNAFLLGPSGSGKSFFANNLLRCTYDAGGEIYVIDAGGSYEGLCRVVSEESEGRDGVYYDYDPDHPLSFNPFHGWKAWSAEDSGGREFLVSLVQAVWAPENGWNSTSSVVLDDMIDGFLEIWDSDRDPVFDDWCDWMVGSFVPSVREGRFVRGGVATTMGMVDLDAFCKALQPYRRGGAYSYLLNGRGELDLFSSRFTVFEVDRVSEMKDIYPLWILCIMHGFGEKMRRDDGRFRYLVIDEAWKAIANERMAPYIKWLAKTTRKWYSGLLVISQDLDDIVSSPVIREAIVNNSDVKIILDQRRFRNRFESTRSILGLSPHDCNLVLSVGCTTDRSYREAYIGYRKGHGTVYAYQPSPEELVTYRSEKEHRTALHALADRVGMREAVRRMAAELRAQRQ